MINQIPELYVETSVINGPLSKDARIALVSSLFWDKVKAGQLNAHISSYVLFELEQTVNDIKRNKLLDIASLCILGSPSGKKVESLAQEYVSKGMVPTKYIFDAYHIASASLGCYEAIVSWNFEHITREKTERLLQIINSQKGIYVPRIKSPEAYIW